MAGETYAFARHKELKSDITYISHCPQKVQLHPRAITDKPNLDLANTEPKIGYVCRNFFGSCVELKICSKDRLSSSSRYNAAFVFPLQ
jgi:hypothetical protein